MIRCRGKCHRAILAGQTVVSCAERTIRRAYLVRPPPETNSFRASAVRTRALGPPGWSVTAFRAPRRPGSTGYEEHSTHPRPHGRPRPYLDESIQSGPLRSTSKVPSHRAFGPRTLARFDA
jgi:hypothetical protein